MSVTQTLPAASTARSPSRASLAMTVVRMVSSVKAVLVPPAVVTWTTPSPCVGSAARFR